MHVEFFGIPRDRAGLAELEVKAETLGQLLQTLSERSTSFSELISSNGSAITLRPSFIASLNGDRFVSDPGTPLGENDCILILSADAGG